MRQLGNSDLTWTRLKRYNTCAIVSASYNFQIIEELKKRQSVGLLGGEILQSKTAFTIGLDASEIAQDVTEAENLVYSDFLPKVSVVGVTEVLESSIGSDNQLAASFTAVCQSGNVGSGSVTLNWRRPLLHPSLRVDNGIGFGAKKFISTALVYQIDQRTTASLQLATFLQGGTGYPQLSGSLSRAVNANFVSTAQFTVPFHAPIERGQLNFSLTNKTSPEVKSPLSVLVNIPFGNPSHSLLELKKTFNLDERHELRLKGVSSTEGIHGVNLGIHRRFNNRTRGSATIQFDNEGGVSLRLGLTHDTLHLILPVRFSQEISPAAIVLASLIPSLGDWITRRWIYPLLLERQRNQQLSEFKRKQAAMLERKQDEAEMAVELLKQLLAKKHATSAPSLLITSASYRSTTNPHQSIDVTAPIQFLVSTENVIKLPSGYRANLLGFYDVDPGMTKELHICYEFQGSHHEVIIPDTEELLIPQKQHLKLK